MIDRNPVREDTVTSKQNFKMRDGVAAQRISNFVVATWTARLATAIALAIGLLFAALAANAAPLTSHPRLWITADDLPKLRGWAVNTNPMYKNGLAVAAQIARDD